MNAEARGEAARRIIEDELFKEAFERCTAHWVAKSDVYDCPPEQAEEYRRMRMALKKARAYLEQVMVTGTLEAQDEQRKRSIMERIRLRA